MMVVEITTGIVFGSMALLADGLHMASHAAALSITAFAYVYARRNAHDQRYSFGTGKVNSLGGFTGAVLLAIFALMMAWESVGRLINPVDIAFNQAILVAFAGLLVNGASVFILGHTHEHGHTSEPEHHHEGENECVDGSHQHGEHHHHDHRHHDHNLRAAYLHVLADALTSLLAILALVAGKYYGLIWMDPLMGIVGALLVARWSLGLLRTTSAVLLDRQGPEHIRSAIRESIAGDNDDRVADLHVWSIGPNIYAVELAVVTHDPKPPEQYKEALPKQMGLAHVTVEVHRCVHENASEETDASSSSRSAAKQ
jgi:cation diffusion facilitator family transporter